MKAPNKYTVVTLGKLTSEDADFWRLTKKVDRIVEFKKASPNGYRFNSRILGIALDSFIVALKCYASGERGPFLATNPWIGVALKLTGRRQIVVTGTYAAPNSSSWRILQSVLRSAKVITLSSAEAELWNESLPGSASALVYGNTFNYVDTAPNERQPIRVFVGGSSDRDRAAVLELAEKLPADIELLVIAMGNPATQRIEGAKVQDVGTVGQLEFGKLMASADVVYLPLREGLRSAGHMVVVGALQLGIPVVVTPVAGVLDYITPNAVVPEDRQNIVQQLVRVGRDGRSRRDELKLLWKAEFSRECYTMRVASVLE
jgi:glycosyltransferase involved in cell wall biosynthesis